MKKTIKTTGFLKIAAIVLVAFVSFTGCETFSNMMKPTSVERVTYKPTAKPEWKGQTIFIDFDVTHNIWGYPVANSLSLSIRDKLIEGVVEDGIFKVQDKNTGIKYYYKISVVVAKPVISASKNGVIHAISATFNLKSYDKQGNLVTAKTRTVDYKSPSFTVATNESQQKLIDDYAHNAAEAIRQLMYESLK